jgi:preprotein translocase subunit Sss1
MDQIQQFTEPCKQFMKDSIRLVKKCTKPDRKGNLIYFFFIIYILF